MKIKAIYEDFPSREQMEVLIIGCNGKMIVCMDKEGKLLSLLPHELKIVDERYLREL